jgi:hypothetical protein
MYKKVLLMPRSYWIACAMVNKTAYLGGDNERAKIKPSYTCQPFRYGLISIIVIVKAVAFCSGQAYVFA